MHQYGILAYPAGHSLSPIMHNSAFAALGMDAEYGVFEIAENDLEEFFRRSRNEPIAGLSVSLPYKEIVMNFLDEVDVNARQIGAVNTVVNKNGVLYGYNTDFIGSNRAIEEVYKFDRNKEQIAVILGAGGAARAIAYGLLKEGVHVWIKNRNKDKADQVALEFAELFETEIHSVEWDDWGTGDVLINATSFWLENKEITEKELPYFCSKKYLKEFKIVMDISYNIKLKNFDNNLKTPLLLKAEEFEKKIITGDKMLLYQAVEQFRLWTGKEAPIEIMQQALKEGLR